MMMTNVAVLDKDVIAGLKDLLGEGFVVLVDRFASDGAERFERMQKALAANDAEALYGEAHGLKGSCRNVGAMMLAQYCQDLEQACEDEQGQLPQHQTLLDQANQAFEQVNAALAAAR